jgi:hypothetical protein
MSVFHNLIAFIAKMYLLEVLFLGALLYCFGSFIHLSFSFELWSIYTRIILGALWFLFVLCALVVFSLKGGKK